MLKNQAVAGGVEILAMADESAVVAVSQGAWTAAPVEPAPSQIESAPARADAATGRRDQPARNVAAEATPEPPEMSTLSFQQYVRERLAQKLGSAPTLGEVLDGEGTGSDRDAVAADAAASASAAGVRRDAIGTAAPAEPIFAPRQAAATQTPPMSAPVMPTPRMQVLQTQSPATHAPWAHVPVAPAVAVAAPHTEVLSELREMRSFIAEQLNAMAWFDGVRRSAVQSGLLRRMMAAGFSPGLARLIVSRLPAECPEDQASNFMTRTLAHNLSCDVHSELLDKGGIFALVGPTGVGKTTSTAKIAARFALKHGSQSVGLVTVDAYRIGGQDQLRSYGRMLGVPVHVAHDAATLADFLHLYMNKKLVLIDTAGVAQRDERVDELLASLSSSVVRKLVVLNAASQAETIDEVIAAYRAGQAAGVVLSKIDEAVKLGGALDCVIRHRLKLVGVANGQRVPEDWIPPDPAALVDAAFAARSAPAFDIDERELALVFQPDGRRAGLPAGGAVDA